MCAQTRKYPLKTATRWVRFAKTRICEYPSSLGCHSRLVEGSGSPSVQRTTLDEQRQIGAKPAPFHLSAFILHHLPILPTLTDHVQQNNRFTIYGRGQSAR